MGVRMARKKGTGRLLRLPLPKCCSQTKRTRNYGATFFAAPRNARGYLLRACPGCGRPAVYVYHPTEARVLYLGSVQVRANAAKFALYVRGLMEVRAEAAVLVEEWAQRRARLCQETYLELWRELYDYVGTRLYGQALQGGLAGERELLHG